MPRPFLRTSKRVSKRATSGRVVTHRVAARPSKMSCAICHSRLQASSAAPNLAKSERRPSRLFGGTLCAGCTKRVLQLAARVREKAVRLQDVSLHYRKYVQQLGH